MVGLTLIDQELLQKTTDVRKKVCSWGLPCLTLIDQELNKKKEERRTKKEGERKKEEGRRDRKKGRNTDGGTVRFQGIDHSHRNG